MATSATMTVPFYTDGMTWTSLASRQVLGSLVTSDTGTPSAVAPRAGVIAGLPTSLQVVGGFAMAVNVSAGYAAIPHPTAGHGTYVMGLMSQSLLTIATSASQPRIDIVVARVYDLGSSSSYADVEVITGTAASSPAAPATPSGSLLLAQVLVPALATSITGGVTDERVWTCPPGGIIPVASAAAAPAAPATQFFLNMATGALCHGTGTAGTLAAISLTQAGAMTLVNTSTGATGLAPGTPGSVPWGIGYGQVGGRRTTDGAVATEITTTFTADGISDYEIAATWQLCYPAEADFGFFTITAGQVTFQLAIDGAFVDYLDLFIADNPAHPAGGGTFSWFSSASLGTTPSKGGHTASLAVSTAGTFGNDGFVNSSGVLVGNVKASGNALYSAPSGWLSALTAETCSLRVNAVPG